MPPGRGGRSRPYPAQQGQGGPDAGRSHARGRLAPGSRAVRAAARVCSAVGRSHAEPRARNPGPFVLTRPEHCGISGGHCSCPGFFRRRKARPASAQGARPGSRSAFRLAHFYDRADPRAAAARRRTGSRKDRLAFARIPKRAISRQDCSDGRGNVFSLFDGRMQSGRRMLAARPNRAWLCRLADDPGGTDPSAMQGPSRRADSEFSSLRGKSGRAACPGECLQNFETSLLKGNMI